MKKAALVSLLAHESEALRSSRDREARLQAVLRSCLDALFIVNARGMITSVSDSVDRIFGWNPEELCGQSICIIMHEPHQWPYDGYTREHFATGASTVTEEPRRLQAVRKDGSVFPCEVAAWKADVPGRSEPVFAGLVRDVTQEVSTAQQLETLKKQLVIAARRVGTAEIASSVLHNVGNVLNSVGVSLGLLQDTSQGSAISELAEVADTIEQHIDDLGAFVTEDERGKHLAPFLIQLSRKMTADQERLEHELYSLMKNINHIKSIIGVQQLNARVSGLVEKVSLADLIDDAIFINNASADRHGIAIECDLDKMPMIHIDKQKVLQILINLISNAKYALIASDQRDPRVFIRLKNYGDRVRIDVQDNGIGIAAEVRDKLFTPGFTTRKEGHGFGLHSSATATREMDGTLNAYSDGPGKGAVFVLVLPYQHDATRADVVLADDPSANTCVTDSPVNA